MDEETKAHIRKTISQWQDSWKVRDPEGYDRFERERQEERDFIDLLESNPAHKRAFNRMMSAARWKP